MQTEDFKWFVENYDELFRKHGQCYLAIKDKKILGAYSSPKEAISETEKLYPLGSFIVQFCNGDESGYTGFFASSQIQESRINFPRK